MEQRGAELLPVDCWRLDGGGRSVVLAAFARGVPALIWFGPTLPASEDLQTLALTSIPNVSAGQLDPLTPLTLCPLASTGWQGHPGIVVTDASGAEVVPDLRLAAASVVEDERLRWECSSADGAVKLAGEARLDPVTGLLALSAQAETTAMLTVSWLAAGTVPVPASMPRIMDHGGRWCGEFQRQETRFATGAHLRESREGRTGHAHFPAMTFMQDACGENSGAALAVSLAWSGGHRILAEELPDGRRHVQAGALPGDGSAPQILVAWSDRGLNDIARAFQTHVRRLHSAPAPRPVHYNCWEAVYFRHDLEELKQIASVACDLGAERFVLDDGWFKGRNDDTTSLGDWTVDPVKYPDGLHPLVNHVIGLGMRFGIWFEPEMVNKDSDLYRAHPDWILGPAFQPSGRHQHVLDLAKPDVADYLFENVDAILSTYPVDYVKWDHNRILTGGTARQTRALYALLDRLCDRHPDVQFESCASGGGRIDYGILSRATRVWLSDSNDALERLRMQHEAARFLPPEFVGSHVGPRRCHTSGRDLPMEFRAWVAAQRHMGFEMDPRDLTEGEAVILKRTTAWWKENREFLFSARQYLLEGNDPEVFAEIHIDDERDRFILFKGQAGTSRAVAARRFALAGLDPDARYGVRLVNHEDTAGVLNRNTATDFMRGEPLMLSGRALMQSGLPLPNAFPATMTVVEGVRVQG